MAASISGFFVCVHRWLPIQKRIQDKVNTLHVLICLISVTVFNFTHLPILSTLQDFWLLVPMPFLSLTALHGMTISFLFNRNSLRTCSDHSSRHFLFFFQNNKSAMFSVPYYCLPPPSSLLSICVSISFCIVRTLMCAGVGVSVCFRIVSVTIIMMLVQAWGLYGHHKRVCTGSWLEEKALAASGTRTRFSIAPRFSVGLSTLWAVPHTSLRRGFYSYQFNFVSPVRLTSIFSPNSSNKNEKDVCHEQWV